MLIREALSQGSIDLKFADIETPSLDASILLAHVLKITRAALFAAGTKRISEESCAEFCALIERRCGGECVAYLTGKKEFRGLEFTVNPNVLVPRPDTETLVEAALDLLGSRESGVGSRDQNNVKANGIKILDLCTGSGAVAISLKHEMPELDVYATDISADALEVAKENAVSILSHNSIIHFFLGDIYNAFPGSQLPTPDSLFSLITSNPPYIATDEIQTLSPEVRHEPRIALDGGISGLEIIERIIDGAPDYLRNGGTLLLEADPRQMSDITILLEKRGFFNIQLYKDLSGSQRVIGGRFER